MNVLQQKAIHEENGPIIIKAGPGTGKTKTLTTRIEYLLNDKQVSPSTILALTFTRKAAAEMRERLSHILNLPTITTFHAFAFDILNKAGYSFEIISERDRNEIIHSVIEKKIGKEGTKKEIRDKGLEISKYKNTHNQLINSIGYDQEISFFTDQYNDQLKLRNLVDYDDLILFLYKELLQKNEKINTLLQNIEHVLVDEFQDTNRLQYEVIKLFCNPKNLFIIGDPYQSIYSFRGANAHIFDVVKEDFPESQVIVLQDNYRSTQEIILAGAALFPGLEALKVHTEDMGQVHVVTTCDEYTEAAYVLKIINKHVGGTDLLKTDSVEAHTIRFSDIAVIYRTHYIGRTLQKILLDSGIPFQIVGEGSPYKKSDIVFISSLLSYSLKKDEISLQRLLYSPYFKIPSKLLRLIRRIQIEQEKNLSEAIRLALGQEYNQHRHKNALSTMTSRLKNTVDTVRNANILQAIHIVCDQYGVEQDIDLQQFASCALQFESNGGLKAFINYLDYLEDHEFYDPRVEKVTLMTMHASKGLEFNTVCICGFEEGIIPSLKQGCDLEEEKRLLYVAITRAKKHLYLLYPQKRQRENKDISKFFNYLSTLKFLKIIKDEAIEKKKKKIEKSKEKKSQLTLF